jgi:hypothetical protein
MSNVVQIILDTFLNSLNAMGKGRALFARRA